MNRPLASLLVTVALFLIGCGHEVVPTTGPHPQLAGEQVKIYQKPPAKFELLGRVEVPITKELSWDASGDANAAFDMLKSKAGAMGATGILLDLEHKDQYHWTTAGYHGQFYQVPMRIKPDVAMADAIFVVKE